MIVIEPENLITTLAVTAKPPAAGRKSLRKRELAGFVTAAANAAKLKGHVCVLLTTDVAIRDLNRRFRRKDKATDVLSFPAAEAFGRAAQIAGDLAISLETAARQAEAFGHPLETEVKILILHGILHLAGMDHESDTGEMARHESALRKRLELPAGLIQRSEKPARNSAKKSTVAKKNSAPAVKRIAKKKVLPHTRRRAQP
jgi:probable rRNA maturation factor